MPTVAVESERRQATILFADISGFTSMSERLDPEDVTAIMNECFAAFGSIVKDHGGVIDKFIGDCVMALFGVPKALEGAPAKAVSAALGMLDAIGALNARRGLAVPLGVHVGINTGEVVSGMVGSADKRDFTVMGDAVNVASRLKDSAETGAVLVGPLTWRSARDEFRFSPGKPVAVKGKAEPVQAYRVMGRIERPGEADPDRMIQSALVGREKELALLEERVTRLLRGEGSVVCLVGEAGIGKSRLCAELYAEERMSGVTMLEGRALAVGQTLSYHPVIGMLKSWAGISEEDAEDEASVKLESAIRAVAPEEAGEILPFVAALMGYGLSGRYADRLDGVKGESLGTLIAKHVRDLVAKAAASRPVLLAVEDLHWADDSTFEILRSIVGISARFPVMFLCAWRPGYEETTERFQTFLEESLPDRLVIIELSPLEEGQSGILARNLLKKTGIPGPVMDRIVEKAGGNPFFIEEVIRSFVDMGALTFGRGGLAVAGDLEAIEIPNSIDAVVMSRVDRLDEGMKELLRTASVIGRSFFHRILAAVSGSGEDFGSRLEGLKGLQLIKERTRIGEVEFLFKHVLVQEAIYGSILISSRRLLHLKVARAIEEAFGDRLPEFYGVLAFHYGQGEDLDKAEEYLEKAGKAALESAASSEALAFYRKALALYLGKRGKGADRARLAMLEKGIAQVYLNKKRMSEAIEHFDAALVYLGAGRKGGLGMVAEAAMGFFAALAYLYFPFVLPKKRASEEEIEILGLMLGRTWALSVISGTAAVLSGFAAGRRLLARNFDSIPSGTILFCRIARQLAAAGFLGWSKRFLDTTEPRLRGDEEVHEFKYAEMYLYTLSGTKGYRFEDGFVDFSIRRGDFGTVNYYLGHRGTDAINKGNFQVALEVAAELRGIAGTYDDEGAMLFYHELCVLVDRARRYVSRGLEHENALVDLTRRISGRSARKLYLAFKTDALILRGDLPAAAALIDEMESLIREEAFLAPSQVLSPLMSMLAFNIHACAATVDAREKRGIIRRTRRLLRLIGKYGPRQAQRYPEALRLSGSFLYLCGRRKAALGCWEKGLELAERLGTRPELGRLCFELAKVTRDHGSRPASPEATASVAYATRARELFTELDLAVDLAELDECERDSRVPSD